MTRGERERTVGVIAVLVSDEYRVDVAGHEAQAPEPPLRLARREPAVEHQAGRNRLDDEGIAPTAARQRSEPHAAAGGAT